MLFCEIKQFMKFDQVISPLHLDVLRIIGKNFKLSSIYIQSKSSDSLDKSNVIYSRKGIKKTSTDTLASLRSFLRQNTSNSNTVLSNHSNISDDPIFTTHTSNTYSVAVKIEGKRLNVIFDKEDPQLIWHDHETEFLSDFCKSLESDKTSPTENEMENIISKLKTERKNYQELMDIQFQLPLFNSIRFLNKVRSFFESSNSNAECNILKSRDVNEYLLRAIELLELTSRNTENLKKLFVLDESSTVNSATQMLNIQKWLEKFIFGLNTEYAEIYYGHTPQSFDIRTECIAIRKILVEKVLKAVIRNAMKFRRDHLAEIYVTSEIDDVDLIISVKDFGIGIPQNEIHKIGEPFFKASNNELEDGLGFEISIIKRMLNEYGGVINYSSELNKFTEVTFKVPYVYKKYS